MFGSLVARDGVLQILPQEGLAGRVPVLPCSDLFWRTNAPTTVITERVGGPGKLLFSPPNLAQFSACRLDDHFSRIILFGDHPSPLPLTNAFFFSTYQKWSGVLHVIPPFVTRQTCHGFSFFLFIVCSLTGVSSSDSPPWNLSFGVTHSL